MKEDIVDRCFDILSEEDVKTELRSAEEVLEEITDIEDRLSYRWQKRKEHLDWENNGCHGPEPEFMDGETREVRPAKYALSPCKLINTELSRLVELVLRRYTSEKLRNIFNIIRTNEEVSRIISNIRNISIYSEEGMEQEALHLIFKMVDLNPTTYTDMVKDFKTQQCCYSDSDSDSVASDNSTETDTDDSDPIADTADTCNGKWSSRSLPFLNDGTYTYLRYIKNTTRTLSYRDHSGDHNRLLSEEDEDRIVTLHVLVVDVMHHLQSLHPDVYKGMVFKYFDNYVSLVVGELQLLRAPVLVNIRKEDSVITAGKVPELLKLNDAHGYSSYDDLTCELRKSDFYDFSNKTFTFIGAGFPLTGVILHVVTGARINLVDCDLVAVRNAARFIEIVEKLDVVDDGAINVFHARGEDVIYRPAVKKSKTNRRQQLLETSQHCKDEHESHLDALVCEESTDNGRRIVVPTDILDIASAIPEATTNQILENNAREVGVVRKRNTRGMSEILYERFSLNPSQPRSSGFQLVAEVASPQNFVSGATPEYLGAGVLSHINVNSCQLYLNTCLISRVLDEYEETLKTV